MRKVVLITHTVFHYRKRFHELARARLAEAGVDYSVVYGQPDREEAKKGDSVTLYFGRQIHNRYFYQARNPLIWQPALRDALGADLVIVIQENRLLINYLLQSLPRWLRPPLALFGHGKNFQSRNPDGRAERWKRFWATRCDWWFAYTEDSKRHVASLGFPANRITVFNNAVDTTAEREAADAPPERIAERLAELGLEGRNLGIFVGGLYPDKRIDFLVAAADLVRQAVPDFELLVVGGGVDLPRAEALAAERPWLKVAGPRFGRDKAELMRAARLFLMPGLLGLAVLDAAAVGLPVITTAFPHHSPELAYLEDGVSGVIVRAWTSERAYADAVIALLNNPARVTAMAEAARRLADVYTIEAMAGRFADGVLKALAR